MKAIAALLIFFWKEGWNLKMHLSTENEQKPGHYYTKNQRYPIAIIK